MEDDLKKMKMEDNLNVKAVLLRLFNNKNLKNKWFWHDRDWPSFSSLLSFFFSEFEIFKNVRCWRPSVAEI